MNTSLLAQELEPLNAQIERAQGQLEVLEGELRDADSELEAYSAEQRRFDALRDVCDALDSLGRLEAGELFWEGLPEVRDAAGHVDRLRNRIARFDGEIRGTLERKEALRTQIDQRLDELYDLHEEVRQAHAREERRQEELVIEREVSHVPYRPAVMPWTGDARSERVFRRALAGAMLWGLFFGAVIPLVTVPLPDRAAVAEIPKRLATLVKKEPPRPEPLKPERPQEEKKLASEEKKQDAEQKPAAKKEAKAASAESPAARKKAESTGVLAFKSTFSDLMAETPVAKLGVEARLSKENPQAPGQAQARRLLVAMQAQGASGGIGNAAFSRNIGSGGGGGNADRIGGVGFARVESAVAGLAEEKGRPLSDGPGPGRTDEEIQIVFDRYKAALYRIYNTELRKNPTLRGKILLRITIEPGGEVSVCTVESTDLASPELVARIVDRVLRFNFGPKEEVPKTTILYPIDFLPA